MTPLLRAPRPSNEVIERRVCYRCSARVALNAFAQHERVCLQRAIESDLRKREQRSAA